MLKRDQLKLVIQQNLVVRRQELNRQGQSNDQLIGMWVPFLESIQVH